jgi:hypothetical protein
MNPGFGLRPPRSGTSRSSAPGRRNEENERSVPGNFRLNDATWELWNIRALWPEADLEFLAQIKRRQDAILAREREALAGLWTGDRACLAPGHGFFAEHPELASGITLSLHMGPYQLLVLPYLEAGLEPVILLNESALETFRDPADGFLRHLGYRNRVTWIAVGEKSFARDLMKVARDGRPVLVYLDGNSGSQGMAETRELGVPYRLPGREIRIRTGLARLMCRLGCPVHAVSLHWDEQGQLIWSKEPTRTLKREDDPIAVTRELFDWVFTQVLARPEQWHYWAMLRQSSSCFGRGVLEQSTVPANLRDDFQRSYLVCLDRSPETVKLVLENEAQVWPGGVLADLTHDRFYPAAGLQDADLDFLRDDSPTLAALCEVHGRAWVEFHGLRLCLLGLARLGG